MAQFYLGRTFAARGQYDEAVKSFQEAAKAGYDRDACALARPRHSVPAATPPKRLLRSIACRAPWSKRPITCISVEPRSRPSAATLTRLSPSTSGLSRPIAVIRAPCSDWPWRTIAAATTKRPWSCISVGGPVSGAIGSLLNLGILYEDRQQYERRRQCYQRILESYPSHRAARLCSSRMLRPRATCSTMKTPSEARPHEPGARHSGHRFRTVGPQPQLPAKDGHR